MTKSELRALAKERNASLSPSAKAKTDERIKEKFLSLPIKKGEKVFIYISFGDEIATLQITEELLRRGVSVYVPLCHGKGEMDAVRLRSLSELAEGMYGIPEPPRSGERILPSELSLIVVPGVAFGSDRSRLGRGAGYYDRFIEKAENAKTVALCREINIYETVPCDEHDRFVDMIITEDRIIEEVM
ncbi:MAG: 5-formyltetrahydrofolate cyclo-ligase [Oscillospiraceae bacterium]|nr:5-formyltetrahydrofolate cyclo-ligase [Oscillospiraceae bacterium]